MDEILLQENHCQRTTGFPAKSLEASSGLSLQEALRSKGRWTFHPEVGRETIQSLSMDE